MAKDLFQIIIDIAVNAYHSNFLIPFSVKSQFRVSFIDPLLWRLTGAHPINQKPRGSLEIQADANRLASDSAHHDLAWFLSQPRECIRIGGSVIDAGQPLVSIVLVVFNRAELSYACLRSLEQLRYKHIELIIVDNHSSDQTEDLLRRLVGRVKVIRQAENLHFLRGCNLGFESISSTSCYALLVNSDVVLNPLVIDQALSVFKRWPETGIVGGQVLHFDGQLQEAGNVIFSDGTCRGIGRRQSPWHPLAQVRRKVDYVSGCLLMIETRLLQELGGFDTRFAPAYYEETDLCIRSWQAGRPVVYEPSCRLHHVEFASSTQDKYQPVKLMQANRIKLKEKHHAWLRLQPNRHAYRDLKSIQSCLRGTTYRVKVLWIDDRDPNPGYGSGFGRLHGLITTLSDLGCFVTIFATKAQPGTVFQAGAADYEFLYGSQRDLEKLLSERNGFYTHLCASRAHNLRRLIACKNKRKGLSNHHSPPVFIGDVESLFSLREYCRRHVEIQGEIVQLKRQQILKLSGLQSELSVLRHFDKLVSVSQYEASLLRESIGKPVVFAGHSFASAKVNELIPFSGRQGLLFMGAMNFPGAPNLDSLAWLAESLLPELRKQNKISPTDAALTVIGPFSSDLIDPLLKKISIFWPVVHLGCVDEVDRILHTHRVFLAPTRYAAGVAHKVQHSLSCGLPVVTTDLICELMGWKSGDGLLSSNEPLQFAHHITQLYNNKSLWEDLQAAGLKKIQSECDPATFKEALKELFF